MKKRTHVARIRERGWDANTVCGKSVEPAMLVTAEAARQGQAATCPSCRDWLRREAERQVEAKVNERVAAALKTDVKFTRSRAELIEAMRDAARTIQWGLDEMNRQIGYIESWTPENLCDPIHYGTRVTQAAINAVNNVRHDILASRGAAMKCEAHRVAKAVREGRIGE